VVDFPLLVVEDELDGQELVARLLRQVNVEVELAGTAEEAWSLLNERTYAGVIIDLALPGKDGLQLIGEIRGDEHLRNLPCIAITAYHTPELRQQCVQTGFDAYYPKPLNRTLFLQSVDDLIVK
jgi:CheY-like chemotaxis protein